MSALRMADFDYHLPEELIAQEPIEPRDAARLMVLDRTTESISHHHVRDLPDLLRPGDILVFNESRVIRARLFARKPTGGNVEVLLLRPQNEYVWEVLVRGRVRVGMELMILESREGAPVAGAKVVGEGEKGVRVLSFDRPALALAEEVGEVPLPPYIHRPLHDPERYQTVYARTPGSVAAPTAGLHFTPELLLRLRERGIESLFVTLHVGLDTFQPVKEEWAEEHRIHREYCRLTPEVAEQINRAKLEGRRIIAVGTTSVRVLETAALAAVGGCPDAEPCPWRAVAPYEGWTDLYIYPGFRFRAVDALMTNFHLPRSTLILLVAAFAGREFILRAYEEAVRLRYRFYSFGDAMLIL
ncbi:MAG: tRNA preQ1(34) S-adenosylmethionine ribosyltransferase-isomerase QueA [Anaerolineae bacterium]|nr:tRNA preQ1(34) S-adenosylmethionine ribosyltransferase-isomerase QueA [Anaerolineae bacterium]MCX8066714.1 tRNA preQ1(34) S-adenosylmethionine ribosyltransferase-isomerase QueA [Anaerolineae bacterium]MDW7992988.1 tRNA preQ1(34) S-adenosylmethionine ribosyltransferase-isomerase QueA [Anaerolineae bacterium]